MPLADNGGFDVLAEIPTGTMLSVLQTFRFTFGPIPFRSTRMTGTALVATTINAVTLTAPNRLVLDLDIAGSQIVVNTVTVFGPQMNVAAWMALITPRGTIQVDAPLAMTPANALAVTFTPSGSDPVVTVNLDENSVLATPLATMLLAQAIMADPMNGALYQQARAALLAEFRTAVEDQFHSFLANLPNTQPQLGSLVLAPAPTLPSSTSGAANLIASSSFKILPGSIKLCYATRTGSGGSITPIGSNLVRSTATGLPVDGMAIVLSNAFVLRDIIRDGFTVPPPSGLGIPLGAFQSTHPLMLLGPLVTTVPGGPIPAIVSLTYNSIFGGIDGTNIRLLINLTANGASGAFSISASIDAAFSVMAGPGTPPSIVVGLAGTSTVRTDLSIAPWVYLAVGILPFVGPPLATILAAADLFAGSLANGPIAAAIAGLAGGLGGTFIFPPGGGLPALTIRPPVSLGQSNAITRTFMVTVPGLPMPLPFVDPFKDNDVMITLI